MKNNKTWRVIHPDKTESLTNFDPLNQEKEFEERVEKFKRYFKRQKFSGGYYYLKKNILIRLDELLLNKYTY